MGTNIIIRGNTKRVTILKTGFCAGPVLTELDLDAEGINCIIWATGYGGDFSWTKFPIFDQFGYPIHHRGITTQHGLYFVGLQWLYKSKSSLFMGINEDAAYIAKHIEARG